MKNLLICGGSGFIGRNCVEHFSKNSEYKITATYFSEQKYEPVEGVEFIKVDLRDEFAVKEIMKERILLFRQQQLQLEQRMLSTVHICM